MFISRTDFELRLGLPEGERFSSLFARSVERLDRSACDPRDLNLRRILEPFGQLARKEHLARKARRVRNHKIVGALTQRETICAPEAKAARSSLAKMQTV